MVAQDSAAQPLPLPPNPEGIPEQLRLKNRWVPVRGHWVITGSRSKLNKTPLRAGGGYAGSNIPADWWTFADALAEVQGMLSRGQPALLFYVIDPEDGFVYGDADNSIDEHGTTSDKALADVNPFTYVEVSPSGRGLRWIAGGAIGENRESHDHTRAIHTRGYISLTGHLLGRREEPTPQQQAIDTFADLCGNRMDQDPSLPRPEEQEPPPVDTDNLSLSPEARDLLEKMVAPPEGVRSDVVQSIANALAGDLGFSPQDVFAVLRHHPGVRQVALDRRRGRVGAALDWLWGVAQHSEPARANYVVPWIPPGQSDVFKGPQPVGVGVFAEERPPPPEVLIDGLIPCDVFGWVGAGGLAKTTLMLWLMVHVVLGRHVAGREVRHPGPVLFITAEDDLAVVRYRLREVCDGLGLSDEERQAVAHGVYVEDVTGLLLRFVEGDRNGNLTMTPHVQGLCDAYAEVKPVLVVADPAIFFGPGEHRVNDAEAALMAVGRRIGHELGVDGRRAAFGWIHHVSQVVAREGIVDQYASRGGTAFADNSRAQVVFTRHQADHPKYPAPAEVNHEAMEAGRVLRLHVAKFSYGAHTDQPMWLVRGSGGRAFCFDVYDAPRNDEAAAVRKAEVRRQQYEDAAIVYEFLVTELAAGSYHTRSSVREQVKRLPRELAVRRATAAVSYLQSTGCVCEEPVPVVARQGSRKAYLHPVRPPSG